MKLEIHPDAISRFDELGLSLAKLCTEKEYPSAGKTQSSHFPKPYVAASINENDIGEIKVGPHQRLDASGKKISEAFNLDGKRIGLEGENYIQFIKLCEAIQKAIRPQFMVSQTTIEEECFNWIRGYFCGNTTSTLVETIIPIIESKISYLEIWIPIARLRVESIISIGKIEIRPISEELINSWRDAHTSSIPDEDKTSKVFLHQFFDVDFKRPLQGKSASVIQLTAEPKAAQEQAINETERALSVLRLFSGAATNPYATCHTTILGRESFETTTAIIFKNGIFSSKNKESVDNLIPWAITDEFINLIRQTSVLDILNTLLINKNITKFQENILDSVTLYSQATLTKQFSTKLIYILAALEGIFLKNNNEPITQNLRERVAMLIGKDLAERKSIIGNINAIYELRSAFLHHAHSVDSNQEFEGFMSNAHRAIIAVITNHDKFSTKQDFISTLDDKKFS